EGALGRLDDAVHVLEAFGLRDAQPLEQAEDDERCQALRRRRRVVERAGLYAQRERLGDKGVEFFQVGACHRAADALEIGGDLAPDVAAVKVVQPGTGEMLERGGQRALLDARAHLRRLVVDQKGRVETGGLVHFRQFFARQPRLAAGDGVALARVLDRRRQQQVERQSAAL